MKITNKTHHTMTVYVEHDTCVGSCWKHTFTENDESAVYLPAKILGDSGYTLEGQWHTSEDKVFRKCTRKFAKRHDAIAFYRGSC